MQNEQVLEVLEGRDLKVWNIRRGERLKLEHVVGEARCESGTELAINASRQLRAFLAPSAPTRF